MRALKGVDFRVGPGEIVGLVGENGAGKSTLMKVLIGLHRMDAGSMTVRGVPFTPRDPQDAIRHGVGMVFQEQSLLPNLTVAENIVLCHERQFARGPLLGMRAIAAETKRLLDACGFDVSPRALVADLSQARRQMVEIARLLWLSRQYGVSNPVLILDEPTTVLVADEIRQLFDLLRALQKEASIVFISHRLEEVLGLATRVVVFKDGQNVADMKTSGATVETIENLMVGHELAADHYQTNEQIEPGPEEVLRVEELALPGQVRADQLFRAQGGDPLPGGRDGIGQGGDLQVPGRCEPCRGRAGYSWGAAGQTSPAPPPPSQRASATCPRTAVTRDWACRWT